MSDKEDKPVVGIRELWIAVMIVAIVLFAVWAGYNVGKDIAIRENQQPRVEAAGS